MSADFVLNGYGRRVYSFLRPLTEGARDWMDENIDPDRVRWGAVNPGDATVGGVMVEYPYATSLLRALAETDFIVEKDGESVSSPLVSAADDIGEQIVDQVYATMQIDAEWSDHEERGFWWWGSDLVQHVRADVGLDDDGIEIYRVHARTPLLRDFEPTQANQTILAELGRSASTSGFNFIESLGVLELAAFMYVHAETADWVGRFFSLVASMQVAEAQLMAEPLADATRSQVAISADPDSGRRPEPDALIHTLESIVIPEGQAPSSWAGEDMVDLVEFLSSGAYTVLATGGEGGFSAEFPFQEQTSLLQGITNQPHPQLGNGLLLILSLPVTIGAEHGPEQAQVLNQEEGRSLTRSHFLGSWCWHDDTLSYVSFYPNAARQGGHDMLNLVASASLRAKWVAESIYDDEWDANQDTSGRPLAEPSILDLFGGREDH